MKRNLLHVVAALVVVTAGSALAQTSTRVSGDTARGFGTQGDLVISQDFNGFLGYDTGSENFILDLRPSADYFIAQHLSLGAFVQFGGSWGDGADTTNFGIGARVGYDIPLSESLSFWPKLGIGFSNVSISSDVGSSTVSTSYKQIDINLFAPVLLHIADHFFIGAGPQLVLYNPLEDNVDGGANIGLATLIGGHF